LAKANIKSKDINENKGVPQDNKVESLSSPKMN
jgi:hypothetical protein